MRSIKFRAWDEMNKVMHFDFQFVRTGTDGNDWILFKSDKEDNVVNKQNPYFAQQLKIMQFTGLTDVKGKDIYEGDILICHEYDSSDTSRSILQTFKNAVVGFQHGSFYYYPKGNMNQPHQLLLYAYKPEIIGNIYETRS